MSHKEVKLPKVKEFILFYNKTSQVRLNPQHTAVSWDEALSRYNSFINKNGFSERECEKWERITVNQGLKKAGIDLRDEKAVLEFKTQNADLIFRTARNRSRSKDYLKYPKNKFTQLMKQDNTPYFIYNHEDVIFAKEKVMKISNKLTPVVALGDLWTDIGINNLSNEGGVDFRFGKKPEKLIERIIQLCTQEGDLIMDFFGGSGTTSATAHKLKRQYIIIEQLQEHMDKLTSRMKNVIDGEQSGISKNVNWEGGGGFVLFELKEINEELVQKINNAKGKEELISIWEEMKENAFLRHRIDCEDFDEIEGFKILSIEEQRQILIKCLDLNNLYINYSEIEELKYNINEEEVKLNKLFYEG
jgi:adenine-specific DNA-methyltransferase